MCNCKHHLPTICLLIRARNKGISIGSYSFVKCLDGCSCECHSASIDEQEEAKKVIQQETQQVMVKFADMPNMHECPSCHMWFADPEHTHKRTDQWKVKKKKKRAS